MEAAGIVKIFQGLEKDILCNTIFIGDGDSSVVTALNTKVKYDGIKKYR